MAGGSNKAVNKAVWWQGAVTRQCSLVVGGSINQVQFGGRGQYQSKMCRGVVTIKEFKFVMFLIL